ncbi:hypothetical protein CPLU01_12837 [Colletotrichum plurivorum]|uniref:Uncharacterized protein n=1 Tax=Colletotrichum plurivorum TaxID=2175906 RepID=A0A8H6N4J4_9PEZI|nr:hypothetical protein CPLU01_12837 [Colletotrichum plurivorum]
MKSCKMALGFRNQPKKITKSNGGQTAWLNIAFCFYSSLDTSKSSAHGLQSSRWEARLMVDARDVSSVMRKGFWFSPEHEVKESGCILLDTLPTVFKDTPWKHPRRYIFADPKMQWTAHLIVAAKDTADLASFKVPELRLDQMYYDWANNKQGMMVYQYCAYTPERNFNTMHEGMTMDGLWPWPRAAAEFTNGDFGNMEEGYTDDKKGDNNRVVKGRQSYASTSSTLF